MKRIFTNTLAILFVFALTGCSKTDIQEFIYAGSTTGEYLAYTPIYPAEVLMFVYPESAGTFSPDINKDGSADINCLFSGNSAESQTTFNMHIPCEEDFEICTGSQENFAAMITDGETIDENRTWSSDELIAHDYLYITGESASITGDWSEMGTHYIGFRFKDGRIYHYGWVEINMETGGAWIFTGYAYVIEQE